MRCCRLPKKGKKACTECRQQKVREAFMDNRTDLMRTQAKCDVYVNHPCSRCRKMKAQCVILDPFKREHKRK
jgi:hypothetical protein